MKRACLLSALLLLSVPRALTQNDFIVDLQPVASFEYSGLFSAYSSAFDAQDNPYLYVASKELGLLVFDVQDPGNPIPVDTLPPQLFHNLQVTNLLQQGNLLYLALGNFQGIPQKAGLAILNIADPWSAQVLDVWDDPAYTQGSAIVRVQGDFAYLGAMDDGLIILNVADKSNIQFVSHFKPDPPPNAATAPNARGMALRDSILFLCYDSGGLRVINVSDPAQPYEIAQYTNTTLLTIAAPAYNNIRLWGDFGFITVDYCGLEVVDLSNPAAPAPLDWYNIFNCVGGSWFGSSGHSNELELLPDEGLLFMSGGDSELLAFNIEDPAVLKLAGAYATTGDSAATWGLTVKDHLIALNFVDNSSFPFFQPFYSDYGGIRLLNWEKVTATESVAANDRLLVYPNPARDWISISVPDEVPALDLIITNAMGNVVWSAGNYTNHQVISVANWPSGAYFLQGSAQNKHFSSRFIRQ